MLVPENRDKIKGYHKVDNEYGSKQFEHHPKTYE